MSETCKHSYDKDKCLYCLYDSAGGHAALPEYALGLERRIEKLEGAIKKAPHQMGCHSLQKPNTPGWASLELCDCWKREVLEDG